jgi:acetyltransferase-like isoleucine patch superfamily enzyme
MLAFKLSIITVCFNEETNIRLTIESVLKQTYRDCIEYIVIDGGSTDNTLKIIKDYENQIDVLVSEKDEGIYDAMNKAVMKSTGKWLQFMNAGDVYSSTDVLEQVFGGIERTSDIIYGKSNRVTETGNRFPVMHASHERLRWGSTFRHGACFINTKYHQSRPFALHRKDLGFALDFNFLHNAYKEGRSFEEVDTFILDYLEEGASNNKYQSIRYNHRIVNGQKMGLIASLKMLKSLFKAFLRDSIFAKPIKATKYFYVNWFVNKVINRVPFWAVRKLFYRSVGMKFGRSSIINQGFEYFSPQRLTIGEGTHVNRKCFIDSRGFCSIGNNTSISHEVLILTGTHDVNSANFAEIHRPVKIGDHVWVGARAVILPGVRVGDGAVVASGAVVSKDVEPFNVVGGIPAKVIGRRKEELDYACNWGIPFT